MNLRLPGCHNRMSRVHFLRYIPFSRTLRSHIIWLSQTELSSKLQPQASDSRNHWGHGRGLRNHVCHLDYRFLPVETPPLAEAQASAHKDRDEPINFNGPTTARASALQPPSHLEVAFVGR